MRIPASKSGHTFSQIPDVDVQRSSFDRTSGLKTTFDGGWLVPVFVDEVLPGDTFHLKMTAFARLATPIRPIMDNLYLDTFFFFVPLRLLWDNFQKFMGEQRNPNDSTSFVTPKLTSTAVTGYANESLYDYLQLPTRIPGYVHNTFHLRAYNLIYNEWFRDQNLQISVINPVNDGPDLDTYFTLLRRGKRHDYFTSSLPFPQKGPAVALPLGTTAPIIGLGTNSAVWPGVAGQTLVRETTAGSSVTYPFAYESNADTLLINMSSADPTTHRPLIFADLANAAAATVNQIRQAFQIQKLYERDARGGTRYIEIIKSHFGVTSPDARLQRPEYLGGGSTMINISPIAQSSATVTQPTPQGNLAATGTATVLNNGFTKSFVEHGVILGIVSARADLSYQQGLNRMYSRSTRFDFYWPSLSHIGEQAVLNQEIYCRGSLNPGQDILAFGYQERYAEYRYKPSQICGKFRSNDATPLDTWHLAQNFTSLPVLNTTFIQDNPPIDRVIAVPSEPHFIMDAIFQLQCARPMPLYSIPGLIDHF